MEDSTSPDGEQEHLSGSVCTRGSPGPARRAASCTCREGSPLESLIARLPWDPASPCPPISRWVHSTCHRPVAPEPNAADDLRSETPQPPPPSTAPPPGVPAVRSIGSLEAAPDVRLGTARIEAGSGSLRLVTQCAVPTGVGSGQGALQRRPPRQWRYIRDGGRRLGESGSNTISRSSKPDCSTAAWSSLTDPT